MRPVGCVQFCGSVPSPYPFPLASTVPRTSSPRRPPPTPPPAHPPYDGPPPWREGFPSVSRPPPTPTPGVTPLRPSACPWCLRGPSLRLRLPGAVRRPTGLPWRPCARRCCVPGPSAPRWAPPRPHAPHASPTASHAAPRPPPALRAASLRFSFPCPPASVRPVGPSFGPSPRFRYAMVTSSVRTPTEVGYAHDITRCSVDGPGTALLSRVGRSASDSLVPDLSSLLPRMSWTCATYVVCRGHLRHPWTCLRRSHSGPCLGVRGAAPD